MSNVGIVLVSHSDKVTEGIKELLDQVVGSVPVVSAGGSEDGGIGTSFDRIQTAIQSIEAENVLVFYDLGSAKMNAEMAIEMSEQVKAQLVSYPILEGAYLAAVEASIDKSLEDILASLQKEFGRD
ncbi:PTS-dependent dihydroxyacetone kinase phosphotransferase subunit DhaM [Bacillus sp. SB49]|uniref:dihydroxyacetone kinase phosphoryl donor subunit DhaM n=1 Tax=Bacillus sp. SB49 TaxID=1071080 RepID=UPI0004202930|nr:dihydroxyacetone kinase phosphoryl donor subunit DhaM [Bacillus sp. SB49]QHT47778.1 PTS-dependent dihydroxyacetone kinase phosphotransferase subunit DhaM [Bacillus sp. SB49]